MLTGSFDFFSSRFLQMVEEMPRPHINAPRAMVAAVLIGASSSFIFLIILLFCIRDVTAVIESTAGALIASMQQATGKRSQRKRLPCFACQTEIINADALASQFFDNPS